MTKTQFLNVILMAFGVLCLGPTLVADSLDDFMPVRGFCIGAPRSKDLDAFISFVSDELAPRRVNTLLLRVDYNYQFSTHPELRDTDALSMEQVKRLVAACKTNGIRLIPQINLLGHQSWAANVNNLLRVYPDFDETPHVQMPAKYQWPNPDGLYCKSYCPLHPKVHDVVFDLVDELCEVFEADAFHAGMDEVFYIGDDKCPRCSGRDKAELFAGEVRTVRDHLAQKGRSLWIWGDRLLDGKTTGLGIWEASFNNTHRAIDMIPKDVIICDWHYERPDQTAVYFAMKGFQVVTCPWKNSKVTVSQAQDVAKFRRSSTPAMKERFLGVVQTVWSDAGRFLQRDYRGQPDPQGQVNASVAENNAWVSFKALTDEILRLSRLD